MTTIENNGIMRADRLLKMILLLQKNKHMRAQDLSQELEVSLSTIYRDIDALSFVGIPVYTQPGTNGGIFIEEGFRATLADLSQSQIISLLLSVDVTSLADIGMAQSAEDAMFKVFNTLPPHHQQQIQRLRQRIYIDSDSWFSDRGHAQHLKIVQDAVWHDKQLDLFYQSYQQQPQQIRIEAYALVSKVNRWYLVGRNETGEYRTYRLTRIIDLQAQQTTFTRDPSFDLIGYWQDAKDTFKDEIIQDFPIFTVELRVHTTAYWYLVRNLEGKFQQLSAPDENHWCRVNVDFPTEVEAKAHILAMATHVEIISPISLQADVKQIVQDLQHHYHLDE